MKRVVILGGTGTLGREITRQILAGGEGAPLEGAQVTIFSRDELKQKEMAGVFQSTERLRFVLGDIRDPLSVSRVLASADTVFHCAALKHVEVAEANPFECVQTNLLATQNVVSACIDRGVRNAVFSTTDKAVDPINVYGMTKGISERIFLAANTEPSSSTRFTVFRWGNVLGSRGSVISAFIDALRAGRPVPMTHMAMTRFWIPIEAAVSFMLEQFETCAADEVQIPPIKAAPVALLVEAIAKELGVKSFSTQVVGIRPGEKLHEAMRTLHGSDAVNSFTASQYTLDELRAIVRPVVQAKLEGRSL